MSTAGYRTSIDVVGPAHVFFQPVEPDLHLIKQVEQATATALEEPIGRFCQDSPHGITAVAEVLVFPIQQYSSS